MSGDNKKFRVEVVVAIISMVGALGSALIAGVSSNLETLLPAQGRSSELPEISDEILEDEEASPSPEIDERAVEPSFSDRIPAAEEEVQILELEEQSTSDELHEDWCDDSALSNESKYRMGCPGF